jgi:DNA-binding NarL/FixJ family response regulator
MIDPLDIALVATSALIQDLLGDAFVARGHRVRTIDSASIRNGDFAEIQARCFPCAVTVVCAWGMARGGRHLIRHLCAIDPRHRIVLIDASATENCIDAALRAGATAVIGSCTNTIETIGIVESASRGDSHIEVSPQDSAQSRPTAVDLSRRETEILQLIVDGFDVHTIAQRLFISSKTTKHHLSSIYAKLKTPNRTDAVVRGLRLGLVDLGHGPRSAYQASSVAGSAAGSGSPSGA